MCRTPISWSSRMPNASAWRSSTNSADASDAVSTSRYCVLLHDPKAAEPALEKLVVLEKTSDGFEIAEADLRLRGPGDLLGTAQTGLPPLKLGTYFVTRSS